MKKFIYLLISIGILIATYFYRAEIITYILDHYIYPKEVITQASNSYYIGNNYSYIQETEQFEAKSRQDILNIIYTYLDHGWNNFHFYCDESYTSCLEDVKQIAADEATLSNINNYVHPFNAYNKLYITLNNYGKVTMQTDLLYSEQEMIKLNKKVDEVIEEVLNDTMTEREKIQAIHDYIINHTTYDTARSELIQQGTSDINLKDPTHKANGALFTGLSLCSGYSDAMALFLNKLEIPNFKVSSENHVWNAILLDHTWYHLDLTWDDPVVNTNQELLIHDFFLLTTDELKEKETDQHNYDTTFYPELSL